MKRSLPLLCTLLVALTQGGVAAASPGDCGPRQQRTTCTSVESTDSGFAGSVTGATGGGAHPARNRPRGPRAPLSPTYIDTNLVPTCTGNSYFDGGAVCTAAVEICPEEGEIRFWVFEATIVRSTGRIQPGTGPRLTGTVCRGATDPGLAPAVAIPALVQTEFRSVVVLGGNAQVSPAPETLVNIPTRFQTDAPASYPIPLTLLNQSVVITAKAERYTWHLGDGTTRTSSQPKGFLEHTYRKAGEREVFVEIEWSGSFTVNGGDAQPITGTVTTDGEPTAIEVQQARSELVRD